MGERTAARSPKVASAAAPDSGYGYATPTLFSVRMALNARAAFVLCRPAPGFPYSKGCFICCCYYFLLTVSWLYSSRSPHGYPKYLVCFPTLIRLWDDAVVLVDNSGAFLCFSTREMLMHRLYWCWKYCCNSMSFFCKTLYYKIISNKKMLSR